MKRYIDDFVEDLNYRQVILYIGNVDLDNLRDIAVGILEIEANEILDIELGGYCE